MYKIDSIFIVKDITWYYLRQILYFLWVMYCYYTLSLTKIFSRIISLNQRVSV